MNNKYKKKFWIILFLINFLIIFIVIVFNQKDYSLNQKEKSNLIGLSYMTMNNEFYKIISEEIISKIESEGDRIVMRDPALSVDRQIEQIAEMLKMDIDVLVLTPVDKEKLNNILEEAKKKGVYIVVLDTDISDDNLVDCTIRSDNYGAGKVVGEYFLNQCKENANVVIMTHETTQSGNERVKGFVDYISCESNINIVDYIECEGQTEIAMPKMKEFIDKKIKFDNVFCLNDLAAVGVVAALEENNMLNKVDVYGVDGSPDAKALIKEGMIKASAAQFPSEIGSKAADTIYQLLNGETVEKNIYIPVKLITKENVEEFGIDRWQ